MINRSQYISLFCFMTKCNPLLFVLAVWEICKTNVACDVLWLCTYMHYRTLLYWVSFAGRIINTHLVLQCFFVSLGLHRSIMSHLLYSNKLLSNAHYWYVILHDCKRLSNSIYILLPFEAEIGHSNINFLFLSLCCWLCQIMQ